MHARGCSGSQYQRFARTSATLTSGCALSAWFIIGVPSAVREHNLDADPNRASFIIGVPPAARSFPQRFARRATCFRTIAGQGEFSLQPAASATVSRLTSRLHDSCTLDLFASARPAALRPQQVARTLHAGFLHQPNALRIRRRVSSGELALRASFFAGRKHHRPSLQRSKSERTAAQ